MSKRWLLAAPRRCLMVVLFGAVAFQGCGDDDSGNPADSDETDSGRPDGGSPSAEGCTPGAAECVNDRVGRVCPADGTGYLSFQCGTGERCEGGDCAGACTEGTEECAGDRIARVCTGEAWVAVPCASGERCADGRCAGDADAGRGQDGAAFCSAGASECATDRAVRTCDVDGAAWVIDLCGDGKVCEDGACVTDLVGAECTPGESQCVSVTMGLTCLPEGRGFSTFECPDTAPCQQGVCRGPVCALGSSECASSGAREAVRTCVDGTRWTETPCANGQSCSIGVEGGIEKAQCFQGECEFGQQRTCGDPTDPSVSSASAYSECRFENGSQRWVRIDCEAPATCDPAQPGCRVECVPGEKRCLDEQRHQECGENGRWLAPVSCNSGPTEPLVCRSTTGGALPGVTCVDEVCAVLLDSGTPDGGGCVGGRIRACDDNGRLAAAAADCPEGICRPLDPSTNLGGLSPGRCSAECRAGEERCVRDGLPLYQTCNDGSWSSSHQSCGSACVTVTAADGKLAKLCGGDCVPGSTRCDGESLQTCGSDGKWGSSQACGIGRCARTDSGAICRAECVPGTTVCVGAPKTADDGSAGTSESAVCTEEGRFPSESQTCAESETCRVSSIGVPTGCVECIGPAIAGGNQGGLVDSRCTDGATLQVCGADNHWQDPSACGAGLSCFVGTTAACGGCFGVEPCTESQLGPEFGGTCDDFGFGSAASCGTTPDCCSEFCFSGDNTFAFCAPDAFSPCLSGADATELAPTLPQTVNGATFTSDDTFAGSCGGGGGADEVFVFTAPSSATFVFNTFGSSFDTVLHVLDPLTCEELACSDDVGGIQSRIILSLNAGQKVIVVVDGFSGAGGNFTLNVGNASQGCGAGEFECNGGACIPESLRCNLQIDCADGSDELDCGDGGTCGNGLVEAGEMCDGANLNGETCSSATMGALPNGSLRCSAGCLLDTSLCFGSGPPPDGGGGTSGF